MLKSIHIAYLRKGLNNSGDELIHSLYNVYMQMYSIESKVIRAAKRQDHDTESQESNQSTKT